MKLDLWAQRLSRTNSNFFYGYFLCVSYSNFSKYFSKYSFVVPPSLKHWIPSTPWEDIQQEKVIFGNYLSYFIIKGSPILE